MRYGASLSKPYYKYDRSQERKPKVVDTKPVDKKPAPVPAPKPVKVDTKPTETK